METGPQSTKPVSAPIWWCRDFDQQLTLSGRKGPWSHSWLCWKPFGFRHITATCWRSSGPLCPADLQGQILPPEHPTPQCFILHCDNPCVLVRVNVSAWACSRIYSVLPSLAVPRRAQAFAPVSCLYCIKVEQVVRLFLFVKKKVLWGGCFTTILLPGVTLLLLGSHQAIHPSRCSCREGRSPEGFQAFRL